MIKRQQFKVVGVAVTREVVFPTLDALKST